MSVIDCLHEVENIKLSNNTVWIVSGNGCFVVLSSKTFAEEYKKSAIEIWEKSIIRDTIPRRLNTIVEIKMYAEDYPEVIQVNDIYYELVKVWSSKENNQYWEYRQMPNEHWNDYYQKFVLEYVIKDHVVFK